MDIPLINVAPPKLSLGQEEPNTDKTFIERYIMRPEDIKKGQIENSFIHTGSIGDVWASLPCVMECCRKMGKKAIYYLRPNVEAMYYEGAIHPTVDEKGGFVGLNEEIVRMMMSLLRAQPYIEDARVHTHEKIRVPLNAIRYTFVNMPYHSLAKWYFYIYPDTFCDLSKPYIFVPETDKDFAKGKLIITRTERYQNPDIKYHFLKKYEDKLVFAGTKLEHIIFNARWDLNIPRLEINDFLELTQALKQSLGLVSNQTQIFQLAEGIKCNRAVELCKFAPNVCVSGANGYEFYGEGAAEYFVDKFINKKDK